MINGEEYNMWNREVKPCRKRYLVEKKLYEVNIRIKCIIDGDKRSYEPISALWVNRIADISVSLPDIIQLKSDNSFSIKSIDTEENIYTIAKNFVAHPDEFDDVSGALEYAVNTVDTSMFTEFLSKVLNPDNGKSQAYVKHSDTCTSPFMKKLFESNPCTKDETYVKSYNGELIKPSYPVYVFTRGVPLLINNFYSFIDNLSSILTYDYVIIFNNDRTDIVSQISSCDVESMKRRKDLLKNIFIKGESYSFESNGFKIIKTVKDITDEGISFDDCTTYYWFNDLNQFDKITRDDSVSLIIKLLE